MNKHFTNLFANNFEIDILEEKESFKEYLKTKISKKAQDLNSFYVLDLAHLARKLDQWKKSLPNIEIFYAVKCNDNEAILKFLSLAGCGFDCASKEEIDKVLSLNGVTPEHIIFSHPCKPYDHLTHAKERGVNATTFDSVEELEKIKQFQPQADLVLRIKTEDECSTIQLSKKFGADENKWETLIFKCKELDLNLIGVSFHVGTGSYDTSTFAKAIEDSAKVFNLAAGFGFILTLLDIGGGFPGNDSSNPSFEQFAETINESLETHFSERENVRFIAEPGRYFAEGCLYFVTKIISRKIWDEKEITKEARELQKLIELDDLLGQLHIEKRSTKPKYFISESTTLSFSNALFEQCNFIPKLIMEHEGEQTFTSDIYGSSDCNYELISSDFRLPKLNLNEYIYFENMGAYSISIAKGMSYNGVILSNTVLYCWVKN